MARKLTRENPHEEAAPAKVKPKETTAQRAAREWAEEEAIIADLTARFGEFHPVSEERRAHYLLMEAEDKRRRSKS